MPTRTRSVRVRSFESSATQCVRSTMTLFTRKLNPLIQQTLHEQKEIVDKEDIKIFERTRTNLDDFLYELDSSYVKKTAAKLFDYIDVVCIEGDTNLLPWAPQANKVATYLLCFPTLISLAS